jgi:hypothetical protein
MAYEEAGRNRFERPVGSYFNTSEMVRFFLVIQAQPFTGADTQRARGAHLTL